MEWYILEDESADVIAQLKRSIRYLADHPPAKLKKPCLDLRSEEPQGQ